MLEILFEFKIKINDSIGLDWILRGWEIKHKQLWSRKKIRPFAIGRKNWLFSASVEGADASAMFYSLIETAKANDLEPFDWLTKVLEKLPHANMLEDYEALLPF